MAFSMEAALTEYIRITREKFPGSIADMLCFEVVSCDEQKDDYVLQCKTDAWMTNHYGTLHGGLCATILDQSMGMITCCLKRGVGTSTTVQLEADYHRPITPGEDILVRIHVISVTRSLINLTAELVQKSRPEKISVSGSAIFFYKGEE